MEYDSDSNDELNALTLHPFLDPSSKGGLDISDDGSLHTQLADDVDAADAAALPESDAADAAPVSEIIQKLQTQLLAGYTHPHYPPIKIIELMHPLHLRSSL